MATVSKETADTIIRGNGMYPGDDILVVRVVRYTNIGGQEAYGIVYENEARISHNNLHRYDNETEYIHDPVVIWKHPEWDTSE